MAAQKYVSLLDPPKTDRVGRYPRHMFQTREIPFSAQPFMIAPVLPGETLTSLFMESRVITDPIANSIIGWKKEYFFFYVRASILTGITGFKDMFVDPANVDLTVALGTASNNQGLYRGKGSVNYIGASMASIVQGWFRDEDVSYSLNAFTDGTYSVPIQESMWLDSITDSNDFPEGSAISGATDAGDLDRLMDAYEQLRGLGLANMTYEDWLRSQGINIPDQDMLKPELICKFSDFQYPSNAVNYTDGSVSSAVSWVFKNGMPKRPKLFKEPGFIIGVSVTRPKVYFGGLTGSLAGYMGRAWDWSPNYLWNMPEASLKEFAADTGPLGDRTTAKPAYWVDMRDLLIHGDQFQNIVLFDPELDATTAAAAHLLPLPINDLTGNSWKYPTETMAKSLFKTPASAYYVRQDGYVSLSINGLQRDTTVGNLAEL